MTSSETEPPTLPLASRWPRFFARTFDCLWELFIVNEIFFTLGSHYAGFVEWLLSKRANEYSLGAICLLVALFIDASIYRYFGNTPGKAFIGLKVITSRGDKLTFREYLFRNLGVWMAGFGFGFPIFNLIMMVFQARRLGKGQQASYDDSSGNRVQATPIGKLRWMAFLVTFFTLYVAYNFDTLQHLIEGYRQAARSR